MTWGMERCPGARLRGRIRGRDCLPAEGAGRALEGALDAGGDPAAVEVAGLGGDGFVVDGALVYAAGVEGEVAMKSSEGRRRAGVAPGCVGCEGGGGGCIEG